MDKPVLSPRFLRELANENPIGMILSEEDVQAWFDLVWLRFKTYQYKRKGVRKAIIRWWSNVKESEILQARERLARMHDELDVAELERQAVEDVPAQPANVIDFAERFIA